MVISSSFVSNVIERDTKMTNAHSKQWKKKPVVGRSNWTIIIRINLLMSSWLLLYEYTHLIVFYFCRSVIEN